MVSKLTKLYSLRPIWFLFYFLFYDLYISNVSLSSEYAAQFYTHGTVLALWGFTLAAESNLWKLLLPPYLLPLYVCIFMLSLTTFIADAFCLYIVFVYRPTYLSVDDINSSGAYATGLIVAIFAISFISIALAFTGFTSANRAQTESIFKRPGWVDGIKIFRLAWCVFVMIFGNNFAISLYILLTDVAWLVITLLNDSAHEAEEEASASNKLLLDGDRRSALKETRRDQVLNIPIIFGNIWLQLASFLLVGNYAEDDMWMDVLLLLCILSLGSTIFDSIGASYIDFADTMKKSQKTRREVVDPAAFKKGAKKIFGTRITALAGKASSWFPKKVLKGMLDQFPKNLGKQLGFDNKPKNSKSKKEKTQVPIQTEAQTVKHSSLTRRKAVTMRF
jgi:hypothetical protein